MNSQNKTISIFDFIEDSMEHAQINIDSGTIDFYDRSFENVFIPKLFNLTKFKYLKELSYYNIDTLKKIVRKNTYEKFLNYIETISKGFEYFEEKLEEKITQIDHLDILVSRYNGKKLNEIGIEKNVTRERVRQIENNVVEEVSIYINTYLEALYLQGKFNNTIFFNFKEIFYFIANDDTKKAIIYAINYHKENNFAIFNDAFSCFVHKEKENLVKKIIKKIKLEKYFNYYDNYSKINNILIFEENILDFSIDIYLNYLKNNNYLFKGNLAYIYGECSISAIISMVIRDYYPKGIILDEAGISQFSKFIEKLLNYPFKINSALAKIDENNEDLILWGKLKRIHISNIGLKTEQINLLLEEFKKLVENVDYLLFDDAYKKLEYLLKGTLITDKYKLYGVIKYYLNEDFYFKKMAVRKLSLKDQTLSELVYSYIDKHDLCTKEDIVSELFIPKSSLFAVLREKPDIIVIEEKYTLINKLNLKDNLKDQLYSIITEIKEYVHRDILFNKYADLMNDFSIVDSVMMFHILRYYFDDNYIFNAPYIQNRKYDQPVTMRNILLDIFKKYKGVVSINRISEEAQEITSTKDFSLIYNLRVSEIDVFRINHEEITLKDNVFFDDIVKYMINNRLNDIFGKESIVYMKDLKDLARGLYFYVKTSKGNKRYPMDLYSFCSYVEYNLNNYKVFNSAGLNNYYDASYLICNNCKCSSYVEVMYKVLKKYSKEGKLDRLEAIKVLKNKALLASIPTILVNDGYLKVVDDEIIFLK